MTSDFYNHPPTYARVTEKLFQLQQKYPFLHLFHIGKSVLGRKIYAVGIGNLKHVNLFAGAFHAQEWLTALLLIRFLEDLCASAEAGSDVPSSLHETLLEKGFLIIPVVNPDGVEIALKGPEAAGRYASQVRALMENSSAAWQANARGIDLNHNFDAGFSLCKQAEREAGILGPAPRQYGGERPASEPETRAMVQLCAGFDIRIAFAFHSQGEEIFYEYGDHTPPVSYLIASLLSTYSGYQLVHQEGLASHGGFKDWFIDRLERPAFTLEIGKGVNPLPVECLSPIYRRLQSTLSIASLI